MARRYALHQKIGCGLFAMAAAVICMLLAINWSGILEEGTTIKKADALREYIRNKNKNDFLQNQHQQSNGAAVMEEDVYSIYSVNSLRNASCEKIVDTLIEWNLCYRSTEHPHHDSCAAPVYHYAFYGQQGMGRMMEDIIRHCIYVTSHGRPCVVDADPRDEWMTWRSFIGRGRYQWEPGNIKSDNVIRVTDKLKSQSHGGFDEEYVFGEAMAMFGNNSASDLLKWSGDGVNRDKVLISANWGFGRKYPKNSPIGKGICSNDHLTTAMQNAFFAPTSLAHGLHRERKAKLFNDTDYGAIHIRCAFANCAESMYLKLAECVKSVQSEFSEIQNWWIVSDGQEAVAGNISKVMKFTNVHHGYTEEFKEMNIHSNTHYATKKFAHRNMSGPIMDWMVLHESKVAIAVGMASGFGNTGGRGNGKIQYITAGSSHQCNRTGTVYVRPKSIKPKSHENEQGNE